MGAAGLSVHTRTFYGGLDTDLAARALRATAAAAASSAAAEIRTTLASSHAYFDAMRFVRDVVDPAQDVLVDFLRGFHKRLLDIRRCFRRRFEEDESILLGKFHALLRAHCASMLQVGFVADQHDNHVLVRVLPRLLQPARQMVESVASRDVIDEQCASSTSVVRACDRAERFLPGRVPNLELDLPVVNRYHPCAELDTDRQIVDWLETLVCIVRPQGGRGATVVTR